MAKTTALSDEDMAPRTKARAANPSGIRQQGSVPSDDLIPMQFRMKPAFAREFRTAATSSEMKYNELLKECFASWKRERANK